jgi:hypothetical protein
VFDESIGQQSLQSPLHFTLGGNSEIFFDVYSTGNRIFQDFQF